MKVAVFSTKTYDKEYLEKFNQPEISFVFHDVSLSEITVDLCKTVDAVCVFVNDKLNESVLKSLALNGVKCIVLRCSGYNNIDLPVAKSLGIKTYRVPAYSPHAVAEHSVALILALGRKIHKAYNRVRENNFSLEKLMGFNLYGKTVGVIGTGQIGSVFCKIMLGFGCKVVAFDITPNEQLRNIGVQYTTFENLLKESDIISLYCPLTPQTHHLINKNTYQLMKQGVMLINTSRGAVINTKDTIYALKSGKLGYLGIDVYEQEQHLFFYDHSETIIQDDVIARLMTFPNVIVTAHQGFFTHEAMEQIAKTTIENILNCKNNNSTANEL